MDRTTEQLLCSYHANPSQRHSTLKLTISLLAAGLATTATLCLASASARSNAWAAHSTASLSSIAASAPLTGTQPSSSERQTALAPTPGAQRRVTTLSAARPAQISPAASTSGLAILGIAAGMLGVHLISHRPSTALRHHAGGGGDPITPALLLDCDGTIVDTERDGHRVAFNQAFQQKGLQGVEWGVELYGELLTTGGGKERMTRYFKDYAPTLWPDATQPPSPNHPLIADLHKLKTRLFMDIIESGSLPLRPGIKAIVEAAIASGWKVAVCSTSNEKAVQAVVDKLLDGKIKHIFAGDMVAKKKPDPAIYNMAAKELGLDPDHCVVVEDSRIGLLAARAAGMACVVTKSTYTAEEDFTEAQLVVDDLGATPLASVATLIA